MKVNLKLPILQLKKLYRDAKQKYYDGNPIMTDAEFDKLEDFLREQIPRWPGFRAGAPVKVKKTKVRLPIPCFSLDKIKTPPAVGGWLEDSDQIVLMDKLDGASVELIYKGGIPVQMITRGDGTIGGDISYMIPHLKGIPQRVGTKDFIVRCEGIFSRTAFQKYRKEFDAPRNAASGIMNRTDIHRATKDLSIVALQLLEPNLKMSQGLAWLKRVGFRVVAYKVVPAARLNFNKLTELLKKRKSGSPYDCDGLVLVRDGKNVLPKSGNPSWGIAFKEILAVEDAPVTKVIAVHWKVSPHGYLIPRFEVEPVKMSDGSTVRFAAAKNSKLMIKNGIGVGAIVRLVKSGDIIPEIVGVVKKTKVVLPPASLKGAWHWDATRTHIVLDDPKASGEFRVQKLARTFGKLDIDFLRGKTVQRLVAAGYDSVKKILRASAKDFESVEGYKAASAQKLYKAIHEKTDQGFTLIQLMDASGVFPRGVGDKQLDAVASTYDLMQLARLPEQEIVRKVLKVAGFQTTNAKKIASGLPKFVKWIDITGLKVVKAKKVKVSSHRLEGVNVTWTGFRDKDMEQEVISNGGNVVSFGKSTTVLLVKSGGKTSSKVDVAKERGIPVMQWGQFRKKYGL